MSLTVESIIGLVTVALFWGVTNPFMKKGAKGIDSIKSSSPVDQFFKDVYFLVTTVKYMVPFVVNQIGSLLYVFLLQQTDLSLTVVVVNSLTFLFTAVTGSLLGEAKVHRDTYLGAALILIGTTLCCMDKLKIT